MKMVKQQRGIALLTALMVVALATIAVSSMASKQHFNIRRAQNTYASDQAYLYALSIEGWLRSGVLGEDRKQNEFDHIEELWAKEVFRPPEEESIEESVVQFEFEAHIEDRQGCFNINNLIEPKAPKQADENTNKDHAAALLRFERWQQRFDTLLAELDVNQYVSKEVFMDWMDDNQDLLFSGSSTGGAEDSEYSGLEQPYRTSDAPFTDVSEVLLLKGMDERLQLDADGDGTYEDITVFEIIQPHICALPETTPININTASKEVMSSLLGGLSISELANMAQPGESEALQDVSKFTENKIFEYWAQDQLKEEKFADSKDEQAAIDELIESIKDDFVVQSSYFQIHVKVEHNRGRGLLRTIVFRNNEGETKAILREQGRYVAPTEKDNPLSI